MKRNKRLVAGIFSIVPAVLLAFSLSGCEVPEPESGLTRVKISTNMNGLTHMPNITISNDGTGVLYVIREYTSTSGSSAAPQSTYEWYRNGNLIDGEQKGYLSIKGPGSDAADFIAVANGDTIKVAVTDRGKTVEASTTITIQ
jgi:hypothetical protein